MKLPELKIGKLIAKVPIVQGGMAIRLSTVALACAAGPAVLQEGWRPLHPGAWRSQSVYVYDVTDDREVEEFNYAADDGLSDLAHVPGQDVSHSRRYAMGTTLPKSAILLPVWRQAMHCICWPPRACKFPSREAHVLALWQQPC